MDKNYGEKEDMFRNSLKAEDIKYFEEEIKVQKIAEFIVSNAKITEEVCECLEHTEKPKKTTKKATTKKTAEKETVEAETTTEEAPKKRGRKPKAE